jgi:hypothetical protein
MKASKAASWAVAPQDFRHRPVPMMLLRSQNVNFGIKWADEEMARIRTERAEERKAGIIQPLPTSDLLDMQESWHGQHQMSKLSQKGQINPLSL